jgi:hypothetical protein
MYLNDALMTLMQQLDPEFTRKFLRARNKQIVSPRATPPHPTADIAVTPSSPPAVSGLIPRQYTDQPRQVNIADTETGDSVTPHGQEEDDYDAMFELVRDHYALLMRWYDASKDNNNPDRQAMNFVTIRTDYQRAVHAAIAMNTDGQYTTVSDGGADTWILGAGWRILVATTHRSANVVGFDSNCAKKPTHHCRVRSDCRSGWQ